MDLPISSVIRPGSFEEALEELRQTPRLVAIAGGTDVMVQLRSGRRMADSLLDVSAVLPTSIETDGEHLVLGAGVTMDVIAASQRVREVSPALAEAADQVGAWPIQCRATVAGNLGNASPAADTAPPLIAAGAWVVAASAAGQREIPVEDLMTGPGTTSLEPAEMIREIRIPSPGRSRFFSRFEKLGWQFEQVISVVSVAVHLELEDDGRIDTAVVAFGAVAPTPVRGRATEDQLSSFRLCEATRASAVEACQNDISPIDDVRAPAWYRRVAAATLLDRLLVEAEYA
jgi:carbon-monoxide dehydrogenase medium subunit